MPLLIADLQPSLFKVRSTQVSVLILQRVRLREAVFVPFLFPPLVRVPSSSS